MPYEPGFIASAQVLLISPFPKSFAKGISSQHSSQIVLFSLVLCYLLCSFLFGHFFHLFSACPVLSGLLGRSAALVLLFRKNRGRCYLRCGQAGLCLRFSCPTSA